MKKIKQVLNNTNKYVDWNYIGFLFLLGVVPLCLFYIFGNPAGETKHNIIVTVTICAVPIVVIIVLILQAGKVKK